MNNFGSDEAAAVNAEAAAPIFVKATAFVGDAIHKQVGETLKLECLVDGIPPPNIIWYKVINCRKFRQNDVYNIGHRSE